MNRIITYNTILEYFKSLAKNHIAINSFIGYSPMELSTKMNTVKGIEYPALVLYNYEGKLDGNKQRTIAQRTISFAVVKHVKKLDNFDEQYTAIAESEVIGLAILSRINYDSKGNKVEWLYNNFLKESVHFNEVKLKGTDGLFGMEFSFDLKIPEPLSIVAEEWADIDSIC